MRYWFTSEGMVKCCRLQAKPIATTITYVMKKLLLIFTFLLFPVQVAWGMMSAYCQQEHYTHTAQYAECVTPTEITVDNHQSSDSSETLLYGIDCSQCGVSNAVMVTKRLDIFTFPPSNAPPIAASHYLSSIVAKRPERPQWSTHTL